MTRQLLATVLLGLVSVFSTAAPLTIGVQTHFGFDSARTDVQAFRSWVARSGFNSSRDEMFWSHVEDLSGTLAIGRGALRSQQIWASMPDGFAGLLILDYGHPGHESGGQPKSDKAREAFARYAEFVTSRTRGHVRWYEVWNEWNLAKPPERGDAKDYVDLARTTYQKLKTADPRAFVLTGSPGEDVPNWRWMRQAIGHGMLANTDGVAVHLYNQCVRRDMVGSDELAERLDALHGMVSAAGYPNMPVFVTEVGWPTHRGPCGITEAEAAAHSLRFLLEASVRPWVSGVWFYELQDGGDDATDPEHRFGLLRRDGSEKPAGCALRELGARLADRPFAFIQGSASGAAGFRNGSNDRWMLWTRGKPQRPVSIRLESTTGGALSLASLPLCGLPAAEMRIEPRGRFAAVRLTPRSVHVIDVPAGTAFKVEELE